MLGSDDLDPLQRRTMNTNYPHEIVDVETGKPAPKGFAPITDKEREILNGRTPEERAEWITRRARAAGADFGEA